MLELTVTRDHADFEQIVALQSLNLPSALSVEEREQQGFVTLAHTPRLLDRIRGEYGHVVAKSEGRVVGYALVMLPSARGEFELLQPMFAGVDAYNTRQRRYFIMGQVCVAKAFRGQGLFGALYNKLREEMCAHFDFVATDVSRLNTRSLHAHAKVGFVPIRGDEQSPWQIIVWDWANA